MNLISDTGDGRSKKRPGLEEQTTIITQAAVELFIVQGSRSVSIAQICTHANVSRPTFYRCFKDKEELIFKLYQHSVNDHVESILLKASPDNVVDGDWLQRALDQLLDAIFENSQLARLVFMESNDPHSPASAIVEAAFDHAADVMVRTIGKESEDAPSRTVLKALMAAYQWIVHDAIKKGLTNNAIKEAKRATWELTKRAMGKT